MLHIFFFKVIQYTPNNSDNGEINLDEILFRNSSNKKKEKFDFNNKTEFLLMQSAKNDSSYQLNAMNKSYEITFSKNNEE